MHPDCKKISEHMRWLGLGILSQAQKNTFYGRYLEALDLGVFAVLQSAHAAEILIKAAIAQEHPLLIFDRVPQSSSTDDDLLSISDLFKDGKTIEYSKLPERLWAATGYRISEVSVYKSFGQLRNKIQHFACPNTALSHETGEFIYKVIDPLMGHFWNLYAAQYCDDEDLEYNLLPTLIRRGLDFRCPKEWEPHVEDAKKAVEKERKEAELYKSRYDAALKKE